MLRLLSIVDQSISVVRYRIQVVNMENEVKFITPEKKTTGITALGTS